MISLSEAVSPSTGGKATVKWNFQMLVDGGCVQVGKSVSYTCREGVSLETGEGLGTWGLESLVYNQARSLTTQAPALPSVLGNLTSQDPCASISGSFLKEPWPHCSPWWRLMAIGVEGTAEPTGVTRWWSGGLGSNPSLAV